MTEVSAQVRGKEVRQVDRVVIRFAGDSGDGMQLTGERFTSETASFGNDLSTLPDFPAEIRAPAGSPAGVSGFQLHFSDHDILTPGDAPNVLVAMNPAALRSNIKDLPRGNDLVVNSDAFTPGNLKKAGYAVNPLDDGSLDEYRVHRVPLTSLTIEAVGAVDGVNKKEAERAKNMFALGLMSWLYHRPIDGTEAWLKGKFAKRPEIADANIRAFKAGHAYGETTESFSVTYEVAPAKMEPGTYRNISGNMALSYGLVAASQLSKLPLFLGSYPITPASDILHELSKHKQFGVRTFQAEDEIAGIGAALGAAFGGVARRHDHLRSGRLPEVRGGRSRGHPRAAAAGHRRPARRPVHRAADQDRAGRPAAGPLRPQRRGSAAGRRAALTVGLLLRGHRGRPAGDQVPHAGDPAVRRLPGQRLRAVEAAGRGRPARPHGHLRHRDERS